MENETLPVDPFVRGVKQFVGPPLGLEVFDGYDDSSVVPDVEQV